MRPKLIALCLCLVGCGKQAPQTPPAKTDVKECYWCKESVKVAALICKHCGKDPSNPTAPNSKKVQPKSVVGEYEFRKDNHSLKIALLEGGLVEVWEDDVKKDERGLWVLKNKLIEIADSRGDTLIVKVETNGDLEAVSRRRKNGGMVFPSKDEEILTFKKIK